MSQQGNEKLVYAKFHGGAGMASVVAEVEGSAAGHEEPASGHPAHPPVRKRK